MIFNHLLQCLEMAFRTSSIFSNWATLSPHILHCRTPLHISTMNCKHIQYKNICVSLTTHLWTSPTMEPRVAGSLHQWCDGESSKRQRWTGAFVLTGRGSRPGPSRRWYEHHDTNTTNTVHHIHHKRPKM